MSIFSRVANILPSQAVHAFHVPELIKHFFGLEMIVQASGVPRSTRLKYCYCNILTLGLMSWYSSIFCQISKTPFSSGVIVKAARSTYNSMSCMWGIHCNFGCNFLKHLCIRMIFWFNWLVLIPFSSYIRHPTFIIGYLVIFQNTSNLFFRNQSSYHFPNMCYRVAEVVRGHGAPRLKVWTRTKILSQNIRYFVAN